LLSGIPSKSNERGRPRSNYIYTSPSYRWPPRVSGLRLESEPHPPCICGRTSVTCVT